MATATLSQVLATADSGVAANAALPAANVGQVIELDGTNFGTGTRVLFNIRDNAGNTRVVSQTPLVIDAGGTRLQVLVPDLATTGDVRVVNQGSVNLGFNSYADAVYRNVTLSFTAGGPTSTIAFSDGGLQDISDESWGLDNVVVKDGATTVFADNFESGTASAAWSNPSVNSDAVAMFSRFGGRFNNTSQRLSLSGLTAGKTYTLSFDLLALDSWDGNNPSAGPDLIDVSVDGVSKLHETLANYPDVNSAQTFRASAGVKLQIVPTLSSTDSGQPGGDAQFYLRGSGFMEGASTVTIGGVALVDNATNLSPFDVTGGRNDSLNVVAPLTLDGPIRITTEGGYAELSGVSRVSQPTSVFNAIQASASASAGAPTNAAQPSAVTGQAIVLQGQGFTSATLVQFQGIDGSGKLGTLTRTGSAGGNGTTLSVVVPALARSGAVTVLGSSASINLQIVPTLRSVGGTVASGNTIVLEGTGLTTNDLSVTIDGRGVGNFSVRTIVDGTNGIDQQLLTLTVPGSIGAGVITVSTTGGSSVLRSGATAGQAQADITPAADIGDTLAAALNPNLGANQVVKINGTIGDGTFTAADVDLVRVDLASGELLSVSLSNNPSLYAHLRIFNATGVEQASVYRVVNDSSVLSWTAPAGGTYYVGVSGYTNSAYNPNVGGSGDNNYTGDYTLTLERYSMGGSHLGSALLTPAVSALADANPATDVGDTLATALDLGLGSNQSIKVNENLPSANPKDVDLYRVDLNAGDQLVFNLSNASSLYAWLRVFDASGTQLLQPPYFAPGGGNTPVNWTAPSAGAYYIGISGYSNTSYNPTVSGSGNAAAYFGSYTLSLTRYVAAGTVSATAQSGTAANAALASANVGQLLIVPGAGLRSDDQLVFTTLDDNGNLGTTTVSSTVNLVNQTISAFVPTNATTGTVRLARDASGVLLQIVPTLGDVTMTSVGGGFTSYNLQLNGSGFAEGASSVLMGGQSIADVSRNAGLDVFSTNTAINLTVPSGVPTGPIRVSTVGGTSAAFGVSLASIGATAASGTPQSGAVASANPGQTITLNGSGLDASTDVVFRTVDGGGNFSEVVVRPSAVNVGGAQLQVIVPINAASGDVRIVGAAASVALQVVPTVLDVQVESISGDGASATVLIAGTGFVEGNNSQYQFGSATVLDAGVNTGPDVFDRYDPTLGQYIANGYTRVTVALSDGIFGAINVKTAGGTSANYSASLGAVTSAALTGTPADASKGSANAGQAITVSGTGLNTSSDILLRWTNINGALQMTRLSPTAAGADGTSATVVLPIYVNGAFTLQMFGSASQPLLQIVPTISSIDVQDRTVLLGSGYVEGAATYSFAGASAVDTAADPSNNIDVYYDSVDQNRAAYLNRTALPTHGLGDVTVTTAGGTSAAFALNSVRTNVVGTNLGDVAVDASGNFWVGDQANPGHLLKIAPSTGQVLQTITMDNSFGTPYAFNYLGLQVVGAAMSLGGTNVPAGSLLVFNGYPNTDRVMAVNPVTGVVFASLVLDGNYDLTGATFNAANGHIYLTENNGPGNRIIELSATTGAQVAVITAPFNIQSGSGLAIDPTTGHLWLGSINGGAQLVEYRIDGTGALTELRRLDTSLQNINQNEISGLSFDAAGTLWVASTQGEIYKLNT